MSELIDYGLRLMPGLVMGVLFLAAVPRKILPIRIFIYILLFIIIRDLMTPFEFWSFGSDGFFWIRWIDNSAHLILFGLASPLLVWTMNRIDPDLKDLLVWFKGSKAIGLVIGVAGAIVVALPLFLIYQFIPIDQRGGEVDRRLILPILLIALGGNLYEETVFRGYLFGYLEQVVLMKPLRAAITSGIAFSFGHIFLAITVTNTGINLLIFALYEGILAGIVRMKYGVVPATLTHGLAIFLLSSGLLR